VSIRLQKPVKLDTARLFAQHRRRLPRLLRRRVKASEAVIEEACQLAWLRLVEHAAEVPAGAVLPWLFITSRNAAVKQLQREARVVSLEELFEADADRVVEMRPAVGELVELRESIRAIDRLPLRQQRSVWLRAFGLSYVEAARYEACTRRTMERQLLFARQSLRALEEGGQKAA
jgi:RNA polymerase sigma factor (sigma-70 family)